MLNRAAILRLVPHAGDMCLLDRALAWDEAWIACETARHRDPANPLRRAGRLPGVALVEPALQAMALHGALLRGGREPPGLVSSLREVKLLVGDATTLPAPLRVEARLLARGPDGCAYRFSVHDADGAVVLSGEGLIAVPRRKAEAAA